MEITLFNFDFSNEKKNKMSEENIIKNFSILQEIFKKKGNPYIVPLQELPPDTLIYLDEFEKRGWIEKWSDGINIRDEYLKYHSIDEVVNNYKNLLEIQLKKPDVNWYEDILPIINFGIQVIRYKDEETKNKIYQKTKEVTIEAAKQLGLKHFLEVPSARGQKTKPFSGWAKKHVLPILVEYVLPITDYYEMEKFFRTHAFFFGRMDWNKEQYTENFAVPPYPEYRMFFPSIFENVCLCEATKKEEVELILEYVGIAYGYDKKDKKITVVYPDGWSYEKYLETLTEEDKEILKKDRERAKRLSKGF